MLLKAPPPPPAEACRSKPLVLNKRHALEMKQEKNKPYLYAGQVISIDVILLDEASSLREDIDTALAISQVLFPYTFTYSTP